MHSPGKNTGGTDKSQSPREHALDSSKAGGHLKKRNQKNEKRNLGPALEGKAFPGLASHSELLHRDPLKTHPARPRIKYLS